MRIECTIRRLIRVINDPNCARMNLSNVKGYLGELYVKQLLESEGMKVVHTGNQSGHDLEIGHIKIDVKLSTLKTEKDVKCWGWALKHRNKKKKIKFTHLVCVALNEDLSPREFYVVYAKNMNKFPSSSGRFKGVEHTLKVALNKKDNSKEDALIKCNELMEKKYVLAKGRGQLKRLLE